MNKVRKTKIPLGDIKCEEWKFYGVDLLSFDELDLKDQLFVYHYANAKLKVLDLLQLFNDRSNLFVNFVLTELLLGYKGDRSDSNYLALALYLAAFNLRGGNSSSAHKPKLLARFSVDFLRREIASQNLKIESEEIALLETLLYTDEDVYLNLNEVSLLTKEPYRRLYEAYVSDLSMALINTSDDDLRDRIREEIFQCLRDKAGILTHANDLLLDAIELPNELKCFFFDSAVATASFTAIDQMAAHFLCHVAKSSFLMPKFSVFRSPNNEIVELNLEHLTSPLLSCATIHSKEYGLFPTESPIMADARLIRQQFRRAQDGVVSASMREKGLDYGINFGLTLQHIKRLATLVQENEYLARYFWGRNVRELKLIATLLYPKEKFGQAEAEAWAETAVNVELEEQLVFNLLQFVPEAVSIATKWIDDVALEGRKQRLGYMLWARLLQQDKSISLDTLDGYFSIASAQLLDAALPFRLRYLIAQSLKRYLRNLPDSRAQLQLLLDSLKRLDDRESQELYDDIAFELELLD